MAEAAPPLSTFAYRAQTPDGQAISGTIDAADRAEADRRLLGLQLRVLDLQPAARPLRSKPLRGEDFLAFNQQLAQLTGAGLPVERGLRLIAQEIRGGRLRRTVDLVAADLEQGKTLPQAVEAHRAKFPPLYARLIDAGIRAGNLSAVLLNLGRHLTLVRRMQSAIWRALAYPAVVLVGFVVLFLFIMIHLVPLCRMTMFKGMQMPALTQAALDFSDFLSGIPVWPAMAVIVAAGLLIYLTLWLIARDRSVSEHLLISLPLIGPVWRRNLVARWCDAVGIGVSAGMDLPAAVELADDAVASPGLKADGQGIIAAISNGRSISTAPQGKILPPMVPTAMDLGANRGELSQALASLSATYQQQAELRLVALQAILAPIVLLILGLLIGLLLLILMAPMLALFQSFF
jgi:type II secretory pathway component PulF